MVTASKFRRKSTSDPCDLKKSDKPVQLTINGEIQLSISDERSLQMLLELVNRLETIAAINEGLKEIDEGKGVTLDRAKREVKAKYGLSL